MATDENLLGNYLKVRRARLDPAAFGFSQARRRTPGLRREEVAQRANISPTWYTWLEQGRGGAASADVLDRIARALMLTDVEREHLFHIGLGHMPERRSRHDEGVLPRLQRVLNALEPSAAMIRTSTWDVIAWNRAVAVMLTDYGALPPQERNILRQIFCNPHNREVQYDWESVARFVVGAFRVDAARSGDAAQVAAAVEELSRLSPEFEAMWRENDVSESAGGTKHLRHPVLGPVTFEYSSFAVEGRSDLTLVIYSPVTEKDAERVRSLIEEKADTSK